MAADWIDDLWGDETGAPTTTATAGMEGFNDTAGYDLTQTEPDDSWVDAIWGADSPAPAPVNPAPIIGDKIWGSSGKTWRDMTPAEREQAIEVEGINAEQDPAMKKWLIEQSAANDERRQKERLANEPDPTYKARLDSINQSAAEAQKLHTEAEQNASAIELNSRDLAIRKQSADADLEILADLNREAEFYKANGNTAEYNRVLAKIQEQTALAQGSQDRFNQLAGAVGKVAERNDQIVQQLPELGSKAQQDEAELNRLATEKPWLTEPQAVRDRYKEPEGIPSEDDIAELRRQALMAKPLSPEQVAARDKFDAAMKQRQQWLATAREAFASGMTPGAYDLYRNAKNVEATDGPIPTWGRIPALIRSGLVDDLKKRWHTLQNEWGVEGADKNLREVEDRIAAVHRFMEESPNNLPGERLAADTIRGIGEVTAIAPAGPAAIAALFSTNAYLDSLATAKADGREGWEKYGPAAATATINAAMAYGISRAIPAGVGAVTGKGTAEGTINRALAKVADRYSFNPALTRLTNVVGKSAGSAGAGIVDMAGQEAAQYLIDRATYGADYSGPTLAERLKQAAISGGVMGATAGAMHAATERIEGRFDRNVDRHLEEFANEIEATRKAMQTYVEEVVPGAAFSQIEIDSPAAQFRFTPESGAAWPEPKAPEAPPAEAVAPEAAAQENAVSPPQQSVESGSPLPGPPAAFIDTPEPRWLPENDSARLINQEFDRDAQEQAGVDQPPADLFGERSYYPPEKPISPLTEKERTGIRREVAAVRRREILPQDVLNDLETLEPRVQRDILDEAAGMAQFENERLSDLRSEFDGLFGYSGADEDVISGVDINGKPWERKVSTKGIASARARMIEMAGGDPAKYPGFDEKLQALREGDYPSLAAEASARGRGDMEAGLWDILQRGQKQFDSVSGDEYIEDTLYEYLSKTARQAESSGAGTSGQRVSQGEVSGTPGDGATDAGLLPAVDQARAERTPQQEQVGNRLSAAAFHEQVRAAATSPEEADAISALVNAFAEYRGETPDEYVSKHIAGVEKGPVKNSRYLKQNADAPAPGTIGPGGEAISGHQSGQRAVRGETQFLADGRAVIRAFQEHQNVATLAHETGHVFRRTLLPEELAKAERAVGVKDGKWARENEERFARMFERYLRDGKAPTVPLRSVFEKFKEWLSTVYRNLSQTAIAKDVPPELREVFDTMLGTKRAEAVADPAAAGGDTLYSETPAGYKFGGGEPTSTKNAVTDAERAARDLPPATQPEPESMSQWDEQAQQTLRRNPAAAVPLIAEVLEKPRTLSATENAVLLNHQNRLQNEYDSLAREYLDVLEAGDTDAASVIQDRLDGLSNGLLETYDAAKAAGTEWGRAGVSRQMMMNRDFTLAAMETRKRAALGGRELTNAERQELMKLREKIAELENNVKVSDEGASVEAVDNALKQLNVRSGSKRQRTAFTPEDLKIDTDSTSAQLSNAARELAKYFIQQGVTSRDAIIDKVHQELMKGLPDLTRRQTMDAISLYGQFSELNKDPVAVKLREIAGEAQQIAKLLDLQSGVPPRKTGMERRTPTDEERRLTKLVNEAKKKYGVAVTDPAKQLASALGAVKTRLRNQIVDLNAQIKAGEKTVKTKTDLKYDDEANRLVAERDAVKAQFDEVFGKPGMTDAKRLELATKAVERGIADYDQRIKSGDFSSSNRPQAASPQLDALKAQRDSLRKQFQELRALDPTYAADAERRSTLALQRRLGDRIARLSIKMAIKDYAPRANTKKLGPMDQATAEFQKALDDLQAKFNRELMNDRLQRRWKEDIAALQNQAATGVMRDITPRQQRELTPELRRLKVQRDTLKKTRDIAIKNEQRSLARKLWDQTGLLRLIQTTGEMSFIGRQGGKQLAASVGSATMGNTGQLRDFGKAVGKSMKALVSEKATKASDEAIFNNDDLGLWQDAGLRVLHEGDHISGAEEMRIASWLDRIPGIKHFNRAGRVFFNELRTSAFKRMSMEAQQNGTLTPEQSKALANFVNASTGYTSLGRAEMAAPVLNEVFYSARNLAASMKWMAAEPIWRGEAKGVRKQIARQYANTFVGLGVFYALAKLAGAEIEEDPRSSDFGKMKFGNTRIDPLMGLSQLTVFAAREVTGERKDAKGKVVPLRKTMRPLNAFRSQTDDKIPYGSSDGYDVATSFLRTKLSPNVGLVVDLAAGRDMVGNETGLGVEAGKAVPITYGDIVTAMQEQGVPKGAALGMMAFFGAGLQTYEQKPAKEKLTTAQKALNRAMKAPRSRDSK